MSDIKVSEDRFIELTEHEKEAITFFEKIIFFAVKDYFIQGFKYDGSDDKEKIAKHVNGFLTDNNILFNGQQPSIWFNGFGRGSAMYWSYRDSKYIDDVNFFLDHTSITTL